MKINKTPSLNQRHMGATDTWISRNCEKCNPDQVRLAVQHATCGGQKNESYPTQPATDEQLAGQPREVELFISMRVLELK